MRSGLLISVITCKQSMLVQAVILLAYTPQVTASNVAGTLWGFLWFSSAPPRKYRNTFLILFFLLLFLLGWDWVHLVLRPLISHCTSPRWYVTVIVEQLMEWKLAGEAKVLGENQLQRPFVHYKFHMDRPGLEPWPPRWGASDKQPELWRDLPYIKPQSLYSQIPNSLYIKPSHHSARFDTLKLLPTQCISVFHMVLTINSDCFPKQH
jgi:hypothetical protein